MKLLDRLKDVFDKSPYEPDDDSIVKQGHETMSAAKRERLRLQTTIHSAEDPRYTGFFLGDSLIIDRKANNERRNKQAKR